MDQLIPVRLLSRYTLYNEGEVAGFPPDVAEKLIAQGRAEAYEASVESQAPGTGADEETGDKPPKRKAKQ